MIYQISEDAKRVERNRLLRISDWTQMDDVPLSNESKEAWAMYRQELRDAPSTWSNVEFTWPVDPASE